MRQEDIDFIERFHKRFRCLRCGQCCTVGIGIALLPKDVRTIKGLSYKLGIARSKFRDLTYTKDGLRYIKYPCPFYKDNECIIYNDRPLACRVYPLSVLKNKGIFIHNQCTSIKKYFGELCENEKK